MTCRDEPGFFNGCGQFSQCLRVNNQLQCYHQPALDNFYQFGIYALMPLFIGLSLIAGLGGGILKGIFLQVILNYTLSESTNISYCLIFGSSTLNSILLLFESHPLNKKRPLINFKIAIIFNLAIPLSTAIGSNLQQLLPQIYILVFQILFLTFISITIWKNARQQKQIEKRMKTQSEKDQIQLLESDESRNEKQIEYLRREIYDRLPFIPLLIIFISFLMNKILMSLISTSKTKSLIGLKPCSWENYLMMFCFIIINAIYTTIVWFYGRNRELEMDAYNFKSKERYFTPLKRFLFIYSGGFGAGFVGGFLGLGAGFIMIPVMLKCGMISRAATANSAFNFTIIAFYSYISVFTQNLLPYDMIILFTGLAMIGGSVFTKIGYILINKYKLGYVLILIGFWFCISNIFSTLYYGVISSMRYGFDDLTKQKSYC